MGHQLQIQLSSLLEALRNFLGVTDCRQIIET
jgi:hypothetical protein